MSFKQAIEGDQIIVYGKALMRDIARPLAHAVILDGIELPRDNVVMLLIPHLTLQGTGSYSSGYDQSKSCKKTTPQLYHDFVMQMVGAGFNPISGRIIDGELLTTALVTLRLTGQTIRKEIAIAKAMEFKLNNADHFPAALPSLKS